MTRQQIADSNTPLTALKAEAHGVKIDGQRLDERFRRAEGDTRPPETQIITDWASL